MRKISSTEYETPQPFFDALDREFHFTLDACASVENANIRYKNLTYPPIPDTI